MKTISITDSRNPLPYSECNNPNEFYELTDRQQKILSIWIDECLKPNKTKHYYTHQSSYGLKHRFEKCNCGFYVTNGQFKGAMKARGFQPKEEDTLNWTFQLSKRAAVDNNIEEMYNKKHEGKWGD